MAESAAQREGNNEARLRKERLASSREGGGTSETGAPAQYGPGPIDVHAGAGSIPFLNKAMQGLHDRGVVNRVDAASPFLDAGAAQARREEMQKTDAQERAMAKQFAGKMMGGRPSQLENQLNRQRRMDQKAKLGAKAGGGGMSPKGAASLAKKNPYLMAASVGLGAMKGKLLDGQMKKMIGRGCVRSLWNSLWPTLGHSVYFLSVIFFIAWGSKYARQYLPRVGEEWFPPEMMAKIPPAALIPLKMAEVMALAFILFWVLILDLACIGLWALMLAVILSAKDFVS